jgi:hypothetical protein
MNGRTHDGPVRRPPDNSSMLTLWVAPMAVATGITIATAGFAAFTIVVAIMISLVATVVRYSEHHR